MNNKNHYNLIATQNHKNNQFNTEGEKVKVLTAFRNIYGYPAEGETRCFLAVSDRNTPIYIVQNYDQPVENRPADIVEVYELSPNIVKQPSIIILRQLVSDLLFGTHSTKLNINSNILIQTWVQFISIARCNNKVNFTECIYQIGSTATEDIHKVCSGLTEEEINRAFYIMNSLRNTTNDRIKAFEIARLNFNKKVSINSIELLSALQSLPDCDFKTKGFLYLAKVDTNNKIEIEEYIRNNPDIQQSMFFDYVHAIQQHNIESAKRCRLNLNPYSILNITVPTSEINSLIPSNIDLPFDILSEILIICLIFYSNKCCIDFINAFKKKLRVNQTFRHDLIMYIHNSKQKNDMLQFLLEERKIPSLLSIFTKKYNEEYVHDAYFLGIIKYSRYKRVSDNLDANCDALAELAVVSYENNDGYLEKFTNSAERKIKNYVLLDLKHTVVSPINIEIHDCLKKLLSLLRKKLKITRSIRKMKK